MLTRHFFIFIYILVYVLLSGVICKTIYILREEFSFRNTQIAVREALGNEFKHRDILFYKRYLKTNLRRCSMHKPSMYITILNQ